MSQVETLMLVALGFAVAALVALVAGRFVWALALGLGAKRALRRGPTSAIELQADRDRLRAERAMTERKLELRLDDVKARLVEQMAEVNRNRNRIQTLAAELEARDADLARLRQQAAALGSEREDLSAAVARATEALAAKDAEIERLVMDGAERDRQIETLRIEQGRQPAPSLLPDADVRLARNRLKRRIGELNELSGQIASQRAKLKRERAELAEALGANSEAAGNGRDLEAKIETAERSADEIAGELRRLDKIWTGKLADIEDVQAPGRASFRSKPESAPPPERPSGGLANVISLAQRIRALKKDITG